MDENHCPICNNVILPSEASSTLTQKGCDGIHRASEARHQDLKTYPDQNIHVACRKSYTKQSDIDAFNRKRPNEDSLNESLTLRSCHDRFDYQTDCLYCGVSDIYDGRKKEFTVLPIRTIKNRILETCHARQDEWSHTVKSRIEFVSDLPSADAVYHKTCDTNFRTGKQIPKKFRHDTAKRSKVGRPQNESQSEAFLKVVKFLEDHDDKQMTIADLMGKMDEFLIGSDANSYGFTHMKDKIKQHFGDNVIITEILGKHNVVTLRTTASTILQEFYSTPKLTNPDLEKKRLIETAGKLLKGDISMLSQEADYYPQSEEIASIDKSLSFIPESLTILLNVLISSRNAQLKIASLGHALVQAARPRGLLAPLQHGLGVQLHHHFGSKFLIDTLNSHGFCCSYTQVTNFEKSAAVSQGNQIFSMKEDSFIQYVADNVDHNICTLDGNNTFHGMGMIATITKSSSNIKPILRKVVMPEDIAAVGKIDIKYFKIEPDEMFVLKYNQLQTYDHPADPTSNVDVLYSISRSLKPLSPSWSGTMQMVHSGQHPGKSSILFLPLIDMNPSDLTCIYSTLCYISSHAISHKVTPIVTFDQPLWLKAMTIQKSVGSDCSISSMVIRLGGFHTQMSFVGAIGHIMTGSGIEELLECVYASNSVIHMLSGKAFSRAVRGHILVKDALNCLLFSSTFGTKLPFIDEAILNTLESQEDDSMDIAMREQGEQLDDLHMAARELYDDLMSNKVSLESLQECDTIETISQKLSQKKEDLLPKRTAKLWLQYLEMVQILLAHIKAERTGNWDLHMVSSQKMLPYLAAAGHNNYTKSLYLYLQGMDKLEESHPDVYEHFKQGNHVIRRSDRYWAGLSPDLVIEQALMRSIKSTGGLTRGRGMDETQRLVWLLSTPVCSEMNLVMQELTSINYVTSEQHKDLSTARQKKDASDIKEFLQFLVPRDPFHNNHSLRSIITGVEEAATVNADCAKTIGDKIIKEMQGKCTNKYTFKKKNQVLTLGSKNAIRICDDDVIIDPKLLFQRLVCIGKYNDNLDIVFQHELCAYPPALFINKYALRSGNKAALADALCAYIPSDLSFAIPPGDVQFVLDGGALLHRVPWKSGTTYNDICEQYCSYVTNKYGRAMIIFDGYLDGPSTKDAAHRRRSTLHIGTALNFTGSLVFKGKKENFLGNSTNKHKFIGLLSSHLEQKGCHTDQAKGDADFLIVQTALAAAEKWPTKPTFLVGDDTDLLVLLCYHCKPTTLNIYFRPEPKLGDKRTPRCCNIALLRTRVEENIYNNILFAHAFVGSDTTSFVYGIGKGTLLKACGDQSFRKHAQVFSNSSSSKESIMQAGEAAMVFLYKGQSGASLNKLRAQKFNQKVTTSNRFVEPQVLPPTSNATKYHSLRVYLQVQHWKSFDCPLRPENWGWKLQDNQLYPVLTDMDIAPGDLLKVVRCRCKGDCGTKRCSCKRLDLECSSACENCHGVCSNITVNADDDDQDSDDAEHV